MPPPVEILERRSANAKHFRRDDGTLYAEFSTGTLHYRETADGPWLDKRPGVRRGAGTNEWVSDQSDTVMRVYQEGAGGQATYWIQFRRRVLDAPMEQWPGI